MRIPSLLLLLFVPVCAKIVPIEDNLHLVKVVISGEVRFPRQVDIVDSAGSRGAVFSALGSTNSGNSSTLKIIREGRVYFWKIDPDRADFRLMDGDHIHVRTAMPIEGGWKPRYFVILCKNELKITPFPAWKSILIDGKTSSFSGEVIENWHVDFNRVFKGIEVRQPEPSSHRMLIRELGLNELERQIKEPEKMPVEFKSAKHLVLVRFSEIGGEGGKQEFANEESGLLRNICLVTDGICYRFNEGFEYWSGAQPELVLYSIP